MKRIFALILCLVLMTALSACGNNQPQSPVSSTEKAENTTATVSDTDSHISETTEDAVMETQTFDFNTKIVKLNNGYTS